MPFDGNTYDPSSDKKRLSTQFVRVRSAMLDGTWHTLAELRDKAGGTEAAVSARIRDLRKEKFGGHTVLRRRKGDAKQGLWEYCLVPR